ncbi:MAG TPA: META domain-containing protein [Usitatibacter sp.]|nr:META domain-containing protein [Usitatibacter sp.]
MKAFAIAGVLAGFLLASCATKPPEPPPKTFTGTRWLVQLQKTLPGEKPWVRFGEGRLEGFGGCNRFAARYVQDMMGETITIGRIDIGRHACDAAAQRLEEAWLDALHSASGYSITADTMIMSGSGGMLSFRAAPEEGKH